MTITVVIPALNEEGNIGGLVKETFACVPQGCLGEVIVVDDGSTDATGSEVTSLLATYHALRYMRHASRAGQSAAIRTGVLAAKHPVIATMDGDGQNDPADISQLYAALTRSGDEGPALVNGVRSRRKAKGSKRLASRVANTVRQAILQDHCPDSGCGIKVFWRDAYTRLPFFTSMHRFMPALFQMYGLKVGYQPVNDRPRKAGQSKYTNFNRALIGLYDLFGIVWMRRRTIVPFVVADTGKDAGSLRENTPHTGPSAKPELAGVI